MQNLEVEAKGGLTLTSPPEKYRHIEFVGGTFNGHVSGFESLSLEHEARIVANDVYGFKLYDQVSALVDYANGNRVKLEGPREYRPGTIYIDGRLVTTEQALVAIEKECHRKDILFDSQAFLVSLGKAPFLVRTRHGQFLPFDPDQGDRIVKSAVKRY